MPHIAALDTPWFQRNPWFEQDLLPALNQRVVSLGVPGDSPRAGNLPPLSVPRPEASSCRATGQFKAGRVLAKASADAMAAAFGGMGAEFSSVRPASPTLYTPASVTMKSIATS